jgi:hypothetical protein
MLGGFRIRPKGHGSREIIIFPRTVADVFLARSSPQTLPNKDPCARDTISPLDLFAVGM